MEVEADVLGVLKVFNDGSIFRVDASLAFAQASEKEEGGVASKDVVLNEKLRLWVRIYLPSIETAGEKGKRRVPVMVYFHGGGFCLASPGLPDFHSMSVKLAGSVGAIVVSVGYRLAPEHRLPVAYDDCLSALQWVARHADKAAAGFEPETWLQKHADLSQLYMIGDSAGANIIHHLFTAREKEVSHMAVRIRGAVMLQPFFGAEERKRSEMEAPRDAFLNLKLNDDYWRLSLPVGCDRDHPFCNPWGPNSPGLQDVEFPPLLVAIGGRDLLRDRGFEYCEVLKKMGKQVEVIVFEEEEHGFYALKVKSPSTQRLMQRISGFVHL